MTSMVLGFLSGLQAIFVGMVGLLLTDLAALIAFLRGRRTASAIS
jgi:hypothetical protein